MIHTFNRAGVQRLLDHTRNAASHRALHQDPATEVPGLWLVGDDGVYLLSNGRPALTREWRDGEPGRTGAELPHFVVYADEVNPLTMELSAWWQAKRAGFGGDDGVDFIPLADLDAALATYPPGAAFELDITASNIAVVRYQPPRPSRTREARKA